MKEIKYVFGFAIVLTVVSAAVLSILNITNVLSSEQFTLELTRSVSIIGTLALAAVVIAFVLNLFKTK